MSTPEEILKNKFDNNGGYDFEEFRTDYTKTYSLILSAMKEYAKQMSELAFDAGNIRGWSGYPNTDNHTKPTKEEWINQNFPEQ